MPSDPSAAKVSSSSSSSSAPKSSSSSSSREASSSSSSRPSSSSSSSSGPPVQPTPFISANAWMSFFLFCCLVLIILQGPLGLSGIGTAAVTGGGGGLSVFGNFGGGGALGGGIGCQGMAAAYVPWCQQLQGQGGYPGAMAVAQVQPVVQQVQAVPAVVHHHHQQRPIVIQQQQQQQQQVQGTGPGYAYPPSTPGYGGQGAIALPGGGGGRWSWYGNSGQYQAPYARQYRYPRQAGRSVQYQRPGLQVQVNQGQGQFQTQAQTQYQAQAQGGSLSCPCQSPYSYAYTPAAGRRYLYDRYGRVYEYGRYEQQDYEWSYEYLCYRFPYLCQPILPYAYAQPVTDPPRYPTRPRPRAVQRQVVQQVPVAPVMPMPIPVATAGTMMGITNMENAFFPLLVGAIALLVIFDYSS